MEPHYSNIEQESLAVLFACEKFHTYTLGQEISVHTDHKPLDSIFEKPISLALARLQRMLLRLSMTSRSSTLARPKSALLADTFPLIETGDAKEIPGLDISIAQILMVEPNRLESLHKETKSDYNLAQLTDLTISPVS